MAQNHFYVLQSALGQELAVILKIHEAQSPLPQCPPPCHRGATLQTITSTSDVSPWGHGTAELCWAHLFVYSCLKGCWNVKDPANIYRWCSEMLTKKIVKISVQCRELRIVLVGEMVEYIHFSRSIPFSAVVFGEMSAWVWKRNLFSSHSEEIYWVNTVGNPGNPGLDRTARIHLLMSILIL